MKKLLLGLLFLASSQVWAGEWATDSNGCQVWNGAPQPDETVTWSGSCNSDQKAEGNGVAQWFKKGQAGSKYEGELVGGKMQGKGIYTWTDGTRYEGEFQNNQRNGKGVLSFPKGRTPNGHKATGFMVDGKYVMQGRFRDGNFIEAMDAASFGCKVNDKDVGMIYTGECKDGLANGYGVGIGRDEYKGMFVNGNKHGKGLYTWSRESNYDGEWRDDKKNGFGIHKYVRRYNCGFFSCDSTSVVEKGLFKNGEFSRTCQSESSCALLLELEPQIESLKSRLKCEDAQKLFDRLKAVGEGYFDFQACTSEREFAQVLQGKDAQAMYLRAARYENDSERGRAKKVYLTIMDRFSKSPIALKASDRLTRLSDVEAVETAQSNAASAVYRANADAGERSRKNCQAQRDACWRSCSDMKSSARSSCQSGCVVCPN